MLAAHSRFDSPAPVRDERGDPELPCRHPNHGTHRPCHPGVMVTLLKLLDEDFIHLLPPFPSTPHCAG
ncbi:MAG: hypothetical protein ANABAC_1281 [Anaerolineae bacterium]|nr:MAG: hypothetical protein ANABAC_1281 [Anaerolineae bacterium]